MTAKTEIWAFKELIKLSFHKVSKDRGRQVHFANLKICGCSSVVERQLPKLNVASSSLVIRLKENRNKFLIVWSNSQQEVSPQKTMDIDIISL